MHTYIHTYIHRYIHNGFGKVIIKGCSLSTCWRCVAHSALPPPPLPPLQYPRSGSRAEPRAYLGRYNLYCFGFTEKR